LTMNTFKLTNTFWVLIVPFSVSVYNLIISRTFFANTIPLELLEAANSLFGERVQFDYFQNLLCQHNSPGASGSG